MSTEARMLINYKILIHGFWRKEKIVKVSMITIVRSVICVSEYLWHESWNEKLWKLFATKKLISWLETMTITTLYHFLKSFQGNLWQTWIKLTFESIIHQPKGSDAFKFYDWFTMRIHLDPFFLQLKLKKS